ncbi:MAG: hypothetical protein ACKV0T_22100 [Planctomycetales bacterium]
MKKLTLALLASTLLVAVSATYANGPAFADGAALTPTPMVSPGGEPVPYEGAANVVELYHCVKYKDERHIAPCAVPMIVTVKDPCAKCDPCNRCCPPKCVAVQICVPPCSECPPKITCRRGGEYVRYDFGCYRVEITSRRGVVRVDYDRS